MYPTASSRSVKISTLQYLLYASSGVGVDVNFHNTVLQGPPQFPVSCGQCVPPLEGMANFQIGCLQHLEAMFAGDIWFICKLDMQQLQAIYMCSILVCNDLCPPPNLDSNPGDEKNFKQAIV